MKTDRWPWLTRRFVLLSEILGYCLSGMVIIGLITTLFIRVDVVARAAGELRPSCRDVVVAQDFVLIDYIVEDGQPVAAGQSIARVLLDGAAQQQHLARKKILEGSSLLRNGLFSQGGAALDALDSALARLPPAQNSCSVVAPSDGVLRHEHVVSQDNVMAGGTTLAKVCDPGAYNVDVRVEGIDLADAIAVGQGARVLGENLDESLQGDVIEVDWESQRVAIELDLATASPEALRSLHDTLVGKQPVESIAVETDIIVGSRSLFIEMFGRGRTARATFRAAGAKRG